MDSTRKFRISFLAICIAAISLAITLMFNPYAKTTPKTNPDPSFIATESQVPEASDELTSPPEGTEIDVSQVEERSNEYLFSPRTPAVVALPELEELARNGDKDAMYRLTQLHDECITAPKSEEEVQKELALTEEYNIDISSVGLTEKYGTNNYEEILKIKLEVCEGYDRGHFTPEDLYLLVVQAAEKGQLNAMTQLISSPPPLSEGLSGAGPNSTLATALEVKRMHRELSRNSLEAAIEAGYAPAYLAKSRALANGTVYDRSMIEAAAWLLAYEELIGHVTTHPLREYIFSTLTPGQVEQAKAKMISIAHN